MSERERRLDAIRKHADYLSEVAERYNRLKWMAEQDASDAFLALAEAAGKLTVGSLQQTGQLLDLLATTGRKTE